jgi:hypothetical protein
MENGNFTDILFLDFQKAFDVVNHKILLIKLKYYKCDDLTISWLKSYLINRCQTCTRSFWSLLVITCTDSFDVWIVISSAYSSEIVSCKLRGRSFTYNKNNKGPNINLVVHLTGPFPFLIQLILI